MGTITFYELIRSGSGAQADMQVPKLTESITRTQDATTSSTPESITLQEDTELLGVNAVELHRIGLVSGLTNYIPVKASSTDGADIAWYGVDGGETVYYRTDA